MAWHGCEIAWHYNKNCQESSNQNENLCAVRPKEQSDVSLIVWESGLKFCKGWKTTTKSVGKLHRVSHNFE